MQENNQPEWEAVQILQIGQARVKPYLSHAPFSFEIVGRSGCRDTVIVGCSCNCQPSNRREITIHFNLSNN